MGFLLTIRQIVEKISMSISDSPIPFAVGIDANNVGPSVVSGHVYIHGDFDAVKRSSFPSGQSIYGGLRQYEFSCFSSTVLRRLHEENEKLFDRLTEKASAVAAQHVFLYYLCTFIQKLLYITDMLDTLRTSTDKNDGTVALVKSGIEKTKTTPAGEYLTSALNEFDPEQHESLVAVSDGANKLLMLLLKQVHLENMRFLLK